MSGVCAPNVYRPENYTCFTLQELQTIAKGYNDYLLREQSEREESGKRSERGQNEREQRRRVSISGQNKRQLWESIYSRLKYVCPSETCWANLSFIELIPDIKLQDKIKLFTFKPRLAKFNGWLSTLDINGVMRQMEKKHSDFKFLGALPSDFYRYTNINYNQVKNTHRVAAVLNLDRHGEMGSHWVALYIDNSSKTIEYFDSTGETPNRYIQHFINNLKRHLPNYNYFQNTKVHQRGNNECGVYSIYYILQRLRRTSYQTITQMHLPDHKMTEYRKKLFRKI